jgi:glycerol uptake facilitator-like aquaporin
MADRQESFNKENKNGRRLYRLVPKLDNGVQYAAEFLGTMLFQILGGGSAAPVGGVNNGLVLAVLIYATAEYSGGQLNPAVSFGLAVAGEFPWKKCAAYIALQLAGAVVGALILDGLYAFPGRDSSAIFDYEANEFGVSPRSVMSTGCPVPLGITTGTNGGATETVYVNDGQIFGAEFFGTFLLVTTVFSTAVSTKGFGNIAPLAIGLSIFVSVASVGNISGGAFNPARFFGPALVFGCTIKKIWVYWIAELLAGALAGILWKKWMRKVVEHHSDPGRNDVQMQEKTNNPASDNLAPDEI